MGIDPHDQELKIANNWDGNWASARMTLNANGTLSILGPNGRPNVSLGYRGNNGGDVDRGMITVNNADGDGLAGFYIDDAGQDENGAVVERGIVFGTVKNFRMDHPTQPDKEIWYASLEGPEAGAYARGTARLIDGRVRVELPDHFQHVVSKKGLTVVLTPGSSESKGLAAIDKTPSGFEVVELMYGTGNYEFDWEIKGVRLGFENYSVIRQKDDMSQ